MVQLAGVLWLRGDPPADFRCLGYLLHKNSASLGLSLKAYFFNGEAVENRLNFGSSPATLQIFLPKTPRRAPVAGRSPLLQP
jgi:hypothetical protein